mmetsp:Transcript_3914/g.24768  ORF Transcript_3914/g.24768 Transcript_3914/m.24768 type:complete len:178 (+) Transcript_3914:87-620(+)
METTGTASSLAGIPGEGLKIQRRKNTDGPDPLPTRKWVRKKNAAQEQRHALPRRHHRREQQGSKVLNGVGDEHLPDGGGDGDRDDAKHARWMLEDELGRFSKLIRYRQHEQRDGRRERCDVQDLVVNAHPVSLEEPFLVRGSVSVGHQEQHQESQPIEHTPVRGVHFFDHGFDVSGE